MTDVKNQEPDLSEEELEQLLEADYWARRAEEENEYFSLIQEREE